MPAPAVALIGCGRIGQVHARDLAGRVVLDCCDPDLQRAERLRAMVRGRSARARFEDVIASSDIEAVVLATPPQAHCEQILQALEADKAVLVEKPLCATPRQLEQVEQALARRPGARLMVAENYYYKPSVRLLKDLLAQGAIGPLLSATVRKTFRQDSAGWKTELGALLEGGIHFIALLSALFEADPVGVETEFPGRVAGRSERHSITRLRYPGGATAELRYAWDTPALARGLFQHSRLSGRDGQIVFESNGLYARLQRRHGSRWYAPGLRDLMGYKAMTDDFLGCLADRSRAPVSDFRRAKRDLSIVFRAYGEAGFASSGVATRLE